MHEWAVNHKSSFTQLLMSKRYMLLCGNILVNDCPIILSFTATSQRDVHPKKLYELQVSEFLYIKSKYVERLQNRQDSVNSSKNSYIGFNSSDRERGISLKN
jgi:hypothetical protein